MKRTIKHIVELLNNLFPISKGEKWDHNGLILGSMKHEVTSIVIALDLTSDILEHAILNNASLIITHHPFLFEENINIEFKKYPYKKRIFNRLIDTKISYFSLHTTFDNNSKGMIAAITKSFEISRINYSIVGKYGIVFKSPEIKTLFQLVNKIKNIFSLEYVEFFGKNQRLSIDHVGFLPGSGDVQDIIKLSKNKNVSVIVTSDVKWCDLLIIKELKINLIAISHSMENVFVDKVSKILNTNFVDIKIYTYKNKINSVIL